MSLDIANAFNTVSWAVIERALVFHRVPLYLRRLIWDYLRGQVVSFVGRDGEGAAAVHRGVPQGSVLGPFAMEFGVRRGASGDYAVASCLARVLRGRHAGGGLRATVGSST